MKAQSVYVLIETKEGKFYQVAITKQWEGVLLNILTRVWGEPLPVHPHELYMERIV